MSREIQEQVKPQMKIRVGQCLVNETEEENATRLVIWEKELPNVTNWDRGAKCCKT